MEDEMCLTGSFNSGPSELLLASSELTPPWLLTMPFPPVLPRVLAPDEGVLGLAALRRGQSEAASANTLKTICTIESELSSSLGDFRAKPRASRAALTAAALQSSKVQGGNGAGQKPSTPRVFQGQLLWQRRPVQVTPSDYRTQDCARALRGSLRSTVSTAVSTVARLTIGPSWMPPPQLDGIHSADVSYLADKQGHGILPPSPRWDVGAPPSPRELSSLSSPRAGATSPRASSPRRPRTTHPNPNHARTQPPTLATLLPNLGSLGGQQAVSRERDPTLHGIHGIHGIHGDEEEIHRVALDYVPASRADAVAAADRETRGIQTAPAM